MYQLLVKEVQNVKSSPINHCKITEEGILFLFTFLHSCLVQKGEKKSHQLDPHIFEDFKQFSEKFIENDEILINDWENFFLKYGCGIGTVFLYL